VRNRFFPADLSTATHEAHTPWFAVINKLFPSVLITSREARAPYFSVVNTLFPPTVSILRESRSRWFSVVNTLFPSTATTAREARSSWFPLLNNPGFTPPQPSAPFPDVGPSALLLVIPSASDPLVEGQTVAVRAAIGGSGMVAAEFTVNGAVMGSDGASLSELLLTVPAGVSSLSFGASVDTTTGSRLAATPVTVQVQPDPSIAVTGRVVDESGNPMPGARVAIVSEGVEAELFDFQSALTALPDLTIRSPNRITRMTAINMRNKGGLFGGDPNGSRLVPDHAGRLTGWVSIASTGAHTFALGASEGARLSIGGVTLVDMNSGSAEYREQSATITLQAGLVPFEVTFYQSAGNGDLRLSMAQPDGSLRTVSPSLLVPSAKALTVTTDTSGRFTVFGVPTALASIQVRAAAGGRAGRSTLFIPVPRSNVDVGDVVVTAR
jgi:hypothetical protein